ncbi:hypothetical protein GII36_02170 [Candidatus Mycosynbacter amalyticus]|uniref:Uncharacterized protein n=1 Tax=Candidatus Mycosynbacter amalyticus TaxID=2665156 RepID=A0A857MJA1_9BACT|nr:hypothetical protein [Candidatus Mycosynbacter amalyticus]QHN42654.1 hypothetical protein GII36_02170 [Candidatus Mycosynbacter amalyticus]
MAKKPRPAPRYEHTRPSVSIWMRLRGWLAARADRASVRRRFLSDHGATRARDFDRQTIAGEKYLLKTQFLEHLADVRDHHVLREAKRARSVQARLSGLEGEARGVLEREQAQLLEAKHEYTDIKSRLARDDLTALEKANYQGKLGQIEGSVKQQLGVVAKAEDKLADITAAQADSRKEFAEFAQAAHNIYEMSMNAYVKVAGRRLNRLGCTNYDAELRDFTSETTQKIKELS